MLILILFVTQCLAQSFYVDNLVTSVNNVEELNRLCTKATDLMKRGGFELRAWEFSGQEEPSSETSLLGLLWDKNSDVLRLKMNWLKEINLENITRSTMLSAANKVFDPVGFTAPVMLRPKLMLQKTWKMALNWDEEIKRSLRENFIRWFQELEMLKQVSFPRWFQVSSEDLQYCSLHTFCDASQDAYAAVVFLKIDTGKFNETFLLAARARIAPLKGATIPRLELLAALIGVRLTKSTIEALDWHNIRHHYWSDSTTVLTWISKAENWSVFVKNRVEEIRKFSQISSWGHISGNENPADLPSRGCNASNFVRSRWWEGPSWMRGPLSEWPCSIFHEENGKEEWSNCEMLAKDNQVSQERRKTVAMIVSETRESWLVSYFSNYS